MTVTRSRELPVARTKEFLDAHVSIPLELSDIATAVVASPAYLTHAFSRTEGVPLRRYLLQLRLARALIELSHTNDLTVLALRLWLQLRRTAGVRAKSIAIPSPFGGASSSTANFYPLQLHHHRPSVGFGCADSVIPNEVTQQAPLHSA